MTTTALRAAPTLPGPTRTGLVLDVDHVTKRYGRNVVVDDVSFTVQPGRVTGFLGPNGSGKSTTMKILLDLAAANHGPPPSTAGGTENFPTRPAPSVSFSNRTPSTPDEAAATTS